MKKIITLLLISIMVFSLTACASPANEVPEDTDTPDIIEPGEDTDVEDKEEEVEPEEDPVKEPEEETKEEEVSIYYTSEEYVLTGDESLVKLVPETRNVIYTDTILEEAVMKELLTKPSSVGLVNSIPSSVKLIDVKVEEDTVYINFAKEGMSGGSLEESLTINQIVTTMLDLKTVSKVQFLLDGEISESLMGHVMINEAFDSIPE